ncbi:MAG TPA: sulfatase [Burkholderiaceae bacterium]
MNGVSREAPAGLPRRCADLLAVVLGVALTLEFLPELPALLKYASAAQVLGVFGDLGLLYAIVGLALACACIALGAAVALAARRPWRQGSATALGLAYALMLGLALAQGLHTWLHSLGVTLPLLNWVRDASSVAQQISEYRLAIWLALTLVVSFVVWQRTRVRPLRIGSVRQAVRFWGALAAAATVLGLAAQAAWPLMDRRPADAASPAAGAGHPDVLLLTIDTISADHLSLYGYDRPTTPELDAFARHASVFDHFYADANSTTPSTSSLMLGERPWRHRAFVAPSAPLASHARRSMLAAFHQSGYRTIVVSTNLFASPEKLGAMPDVDSYDISQPWARTCALDPGVLVARILHPQSRSILGNNGLWQATHALWVRLLLETGTCPPSGHFDPADALRIAGERWHAPADRPRFVWVHLTPPHDPYAAPPPFVGLFDAGPQARTLLDSSPVYLYLGRALAVRQRHELMGRYDEAIRYADAAVGDFLRSLEADGRLRNTLVVISADHGENFWHDYGGHGGPELYDEAVHVPLIVREPGQSTALRIATPAEHADLLPTVAALAGVAVPGDVEGQSLVGALRGAPSPRPVFAMNFERSAREGALEQGSVAMIDYPWKLQTRVGPIDATTPDSVRDRLYRLDRDPREAEDVARANPEIVARMRAAVDAQLALNRKPRP